MPCCSMPSISRLLHSEVHVPSALLRPSCRRRVQQRVFAILHQRGAPAAAASGICSRTSSNLSIKHLGAMPCRNPAAISRRCCRAAAALPPLAMINVDFASPSLVLGIALIGCGVALLQVRNMQREVSRDADIVVAAMISIVGSTLIFQGWRLDPLLLLCQALTTSVAFWYGLETFKLRQQVTDTVEEDGIAGQLPPPEGYNQVNESYSSPARSGFLPPADSQIPPWGMQQQQQQQPQQSGYSSRWGLPPADQSRQQYGSYLDQQQQRMPEGAYAGYEDQYAAGSTGQGLPPMQQQQQFGAPGDYDASTGYSSSAYGQQPQQQQYNAPASGYGVQEGWYGAGVGQPLYGQQQYPPGMGAAGTGPVVGPEGAAAAAAGTGNEYRLMPGGAVGIAGYVADGSAPLPLPPADQQQQQQPQATQVRRAGQAAYERVDDWE